MKQGLKTGVQKGQRTLLASLLASSLAPLATGIALFLNRSATQLADFIRRTVELIALFISWLVFRYLVREENISEAGKTHLERLVNSAVALALACSGLVLLLAALFSFGGHQGGSKVLLGLIIAVLGFVVNFIFWWRYRALARENYSSIIAAQRRLYLAKLFVDLGVITALSTLALFPNRVFTKYVDTLGSVLVASYLLWSSFRTWRGAKEEKTPAVGES